MSKWKTSCALLIAALVLSASPRSGQAQEPGLIAQMNFDALTGDEFAVTGSARKAVNHGAQMIQGVDGSAVRFDGVTNTVTTDLVKKGQSLTALTVEAWVSPEKPRNSNLVVGAIEKMPEEQNDFSFVLRMRSNWEFWLQVRTTDNQLRLMQPFKPVFDSISFPKPTWYHLVATYDGEMTTLYVNGEQVAQQKFEGGIKPIKPIDGISLGGPGDAYRGAMDNLRVYDRALPAAEVLVHYNARANFKPAAAAKTNAVKGTIDGAPYNYAWQSVPIANGQIGFSNTGEIVPFYIPASANHLDISPLSLLDQAPRQSSFYEDVSGNITARRDGTSTLEVNGTTWQGIKVRQTMDVAADSTARLRYELTATEPGAPMPQIWWAQSAWFSAGRFTSYDPSGALITGNWSDLNGEVNFGKMLEVNMVRGSARMVCTFSPDTLYRLRGSRSGKAWLNGYSYLEGSLVPANWQGWEAGKPVVLDFSLKIEPDNLPPRLNRAQAKQVTEDKPFDFSDLYEPDTDKLALLPVGRPDPVFFDDEAVRFEVRVPKGMQPNVNRCRWTLNGTTTGKQLNSGQVKQQPARPGVIKAVGAAHTVVKNGQIVQGGPFWHWRGEVTFPAPKTGVYLLKVEALDQDGKVLGEQNQEVAIAGKIVQPLSKPGEPLPANILKKMDEVDFSKPAPGHDFFSYSGQSQVVQSKQGAYRRTNTFSEELKRLGGSGWWANDWFGARFNVSPGKVYIVETEYPDLDGISMSTYLMEPKADPTPGKARGVERVGTGIVTGMGTPHDNTIKKFQTVYFASAPWVAVCYQNGHSGRPAGKEFSAAAVRRVTLYEVQGELPQTSLPSNERYIGAYLEHAGVGLGSFGILNLRGENADRSDPPKPDEYYRGLYPAVSNLIKYMRYRGDNVLFAGVARYRSVDFPSRTYAPEASAAQHDTPAFLARMFERNNLKLVLTVMPTSPPTTGRLHENTRYDVAQGADATVPVDNEGNQFTQSPYSPSANPFHPKVREEYARLARELGERYGKMPAVLGIGWMSGMGYWEPTLPNYGSGVPAKEWRAFLLKWSYDDETMRQFEAWANVKLPGTPGDVKRFKERHDWIIENTLEKFIDFRGWAMAQTHLGFSKAFHEAAPNKDYIYMDYFATALQNELGDMSPLDATRWVTSNPQYLKGPNFVHMPYQPEYNGTTLWEHGTLNYEWMPQVKRFVNDDELAKAWDSQGKTARFLHRQFYEQTLRVDKTNSWLWAPVADDVLAIITYPQQAGQGYLADFAMTLARATPDYYSYMWSDSLLPMGNELEHQTVATVYRSLPTGHYSEADRQNGVFCRTHDGKKAFYVVNTNDAPTTVTLKTPLSGVFTEALQKKAVTFNGATERFTLKPYEIRVFVKS